jgi:hypothetical protein
MRLLIAMLLFAINIQNLSTNITEISKEKVVDTYITRFQINQEYKKVIDRANKVLGTSSHTTNLPILFPIKLEDFKRISGKYGIRERHPILKYTTLHTGIDIAANKGSEVFATASGKIIRRDYHFFGYGRFVEIDHGHNITTLYAHLSATHLFKGDSVRVGDLIGQVGSTGLSTGNHLHYEIRKNGISIDPFSLFSDNVENAEEIFIIKSTISKFVQMNQKVITKKLTLAELKELKDSYTESINSLEYEIKGDSIKTTKTLKNRIQIIVTKQENLIRIKELLAKANSLEIPTKLEDGSTKLISNNYRIFQLALLRDFRKTMSTASKNDKFEEIATEVISEITKEIDSLDANIRSFNTSSKIEIELIEEV